MRTYEEYHKILELWERGFNKKQIARLTGIPRPTVRDCINRYQSLEGLVTSTIAKKNQDIQAVVESWSQEQRQWYAYLLAVYLGDGYICKTRKTYRLRVSCDSRYPQIIQRISSAMQQFCPQNSINIVKFKNSKGIEVACYSNSWRQLFPQHGVGEKHTRKIALEAWQRAILEEYPIEFLRGLIHSDGCRIDPVVNGKVYSRYQFTNISEDIQQLFRDVCDLLNIHYTFWGRNFTIARRKDVELLDREIGPKA